jgi:hypothetical protein
MGNLRRIKRACQSPPPWPTPPAGGGSQRLELDRSELEAILERAKTTPMSEAEHAKLHAVVETLVFLTQELEKKHVSIQRLKQLLFGATTETTRKVLEKILDQTSKESTSGDDAAQKSESQAAQKATGHGRHGAEDYVGAEKVRVPHESLKPGDPCPNCKKVRLLWGPRCTSCRSCAATCAARSSRPERRRAWEPTSTMPNRRA